MPRTAFMQGQGDAPHIEHGNALHIPGGGGCLCSYRTEAVFISVTELDHIIQRRFQSRGTNRCPLCRSVWRFAAL